MHITAFKCSVYVDVLMYSRMTSKPLLRPFAWPHPRNPSPRKYFYIWTSDRQDPLCIIQSPRLDYCAVFETLRLAPERAAAVATQEAAHTEASIGYLAVDLWRADRDVEAGSGHDVTQAVSTSANFFAVGAMADNL
jgi:hypothetical protein